MQALLRPLKVMTHPVWSFYTRIHTDSEEEEGETKGEEPAHDDDELHYSDLILILILMILQYEQKRL